MIHPLAVIGEPPEMRDHDGPGFPPSIDPSARIEALVTVDAGVRQPTAVGARTWLMKKVHVGHDAWVGADCEIAPLTSIGGHVTIGNRVKVGQGATFKPFVVVGDGARIGMGAVVIHDVPPGETWAGNPARNLHAPPSEDLALWSEWWKAREASRAS
jgi:UDP-N-acetylglucosamine acyltransferase